MKPYENWFLLVVLWLSLLIIGTVCCVVLWGVVAGMRHVPVEVYAGIGLGVGVVLFLFIFGSPRSYTHVAYERLIRVHLVYHRNNGYRWVMADDMERIVLTEVHFRGESFHVAEIQFRQRRPSFLGRPWGARFGISHPGGVDDLKAWAGARGILVEERSSV